jgi:hypothetical protein
MFIDFPEAKIVENINKTTVNAVAQHFGEKSVFGDDQDGILR